MKMKRSTISGTPRTGMLPCLRVCQDLSPKIIRRRTAKPRNGTRCIVSARKKDYMSMRESMFTVPPEEKGTHHCIIRFLSWRSGILCIFRDVCNQQNPARRSQAMSVSALISLPAKCSAFKFWFWSIGLRCPPRSAFSGFAEARNCFLFVTNNIIRYQ